MSKKKDYNFSNLYNPFLFPDFNNYYGKVENYLAFLVLRFYDDPGDFMRKLPTAFRFVRVWRERRLRNLFREEYVVFNALTRQVAVLTKDDDPITVAIKLFRVIRGIDFLNDPVFNRAFKYVIPMVVSVNSILTPEYP